MVAQKYCHGFAKLSLFVFFAINLNAIHVFSDPADLGGDPMLFHQDIKSKYDEIRDDYGGKLSTKEQKIMEETVLKHDDKGKSDRFAERKNGDLETEESPSKTVRFEKYDSDSRLRRRRRYYRSRSNGTPTTKLGAIVAGVFLAIFGCCYCYFTQPEREAENTSTDLTQPIMSSEEPVADPVADAVATNAVATDAVGAQAV